MGANFSVLETIVNGNYEGNEWVKLGDPPPPNPHSKGNL